MCLLACVISCSVGSLFVLLLLLGSFVACLFPLMPLRAMLFGECDCSVGHVFVCVFLFVCLHV